MKDYEINNETLAIIPVSLVKSLIIEKTNEFIVEKNAVKIIDNSCKYFGSSLNGRHDGTKNLIGVSHKAPIIIEETKNIIFFPTNSPRIESCNWISLRNICEFKRKDNKSLIIFNNGYNLEIDISYGSLENQILRATRLESVLRIRKEEKN